MFRELLGTGETIGMKFEYKVQETPNGLAQAFVLGAEFLNGEPGCLILGDNMFYGQGFTTMLRNAVEKCQKGVTTMIKNNQNTQKLFKYYHLQGNHPQNSFQT